MAAFIGEPPRNEAIAAARAASSVGFVVAQSTRSRANWSACCRPSSSLVRASKIIRGIDACRINWGSGRPRK